MQNLLKAFLKDETGATAVEYGLIAAMVSIAVIAGASSIGSKLGTVFNTLSSSLETSR